MNNSNENSPDLGHTGGHGINTLTIGDREYLLVETGGGSAIHLAREALAADDLARAAVPSNFLDDDASLYEPTAALYDQAALLAVRWQTTTLCGREWALMAAGEPGPIHRWQEEANAPTCRACMRSVDRFFPPPQPDERVGVLARLVAEAIVKHGTAEVIGVPGDQLLGFRSRVRAEVRKRGIRQLNTFVRGDLFVAISDEAYEAIPPEIRDERDRDVARALDAAYRGAPSQRRSDQPWHFHWRAWNIAD
jgi:hypothetical protein